MPIKGAGVLTSVLDMQAKKCRMNDMAPYEHGYSFIPRTAHPKDEAPLFIEAGGTLHGQKK